MDKFDIVEEPVVDLQSLSSREKILSKIVNNRDSREYVSCISRGFVWIFMFLVSFLSVFLIFKTPYYLYYDQYNPIKISEGKTTISDLVAPATNIDASKLNLTDQFAVKNLDNKNKSTNNDNIIAPNSDEKDSDNADSQATVDNSSSNYSKNYLSDTKSDEMKALASKSIEDAKNQQSKNQSNQEDLKSPQNDLTSQKDTPEKNKTVLEDSEITNILKSTKSDDSDKLTPAKNTTSLSKSDLSNRVNVEEQLKQVSKMREEINKRPLQLNETKNSTKYYLQKDAQKDVNPVMSVSSNNKGSNSLEEISPNDNKSKIPADKVWLVNIFSGPSRDVLSNKLEQIKTTYSKYLNSELQYYFTQTNIGSKIAFRIAVAPKQVQSFKTSADAKQFCDDFKSVGIPCFISEVATKDLPMFIVN